MIQTVMVANRPPAAAARAVLAANNTQRVSTAVAMSMLVGAGVASSAGAVAASISGKPTRVAPLAVRYLDIAESPFFMPGPGGP